MHSRLRLWLLVGLMMGRFSVASAQTAILVVPEELSFAAPARSTAPSVATLNVAAAGANSPLTINVRYLGLAQGWLKVNASSPTTPATLTVTADPSRLEAGTYLAQITLQAGNVGKVVNVFLAVGAGASGGSLLVTPSALTFVGTPGQTDPSVASLSVAAADGSALNFRVSTTVPQWLTVSPLPTAAPATIAVEAYPGRMPAGVYSGTVTVTPLPAGLPVVIPVTMVSAGGNAVPDAIELTQSAIIVTHQNTISDVPPLQEVGISVTTGFSQYTAATTDPWIQLRSTSNSAWDSSVTDYAPGSFTVKVDPTAVTTGTPGPPYSGTITVTSANLPAVRLPVTLRVTSVPDLNAVPSSVNFEDPDVLEASVAIRSTNRTALTFSASVPNNTPWLSVTPTVASTSSDPDNPVILTIRANPAQLTPDVYLGSVVIRIADAPVAQQLTIPVRFKVSTAPASSDIVFTPDTVNLTGTVGGTNPSAAIDLRTQTSTAQDFTASATSTGGWLRVDPFSGKTPARLNVSANLAAVPGPGTNEGSVVITSLLTGTQFTIPVVLVLGEEVIASDPPAITFTQPAKGADAPSQTVRITAPVPTAFRVLEVPSWARVSSSAGTTPATLTVWSELSLVPPGSVTSAIRVAGPRNEISIPVNFVYAAPPQPKVAPESFTLTSVLGAAVPPQTLTIDTGSEPGTFTVTANTETGAAWLAASPVSGSTPGTVTLTIAPDRLVPGQNKGTVAVNISSGGATYTRSIPVVVTAGTPEAAIYSVLHGATLLPTAVAPGQIVSITGKGFGTAAGTPARPSSAGAFETTLAGVRVTFDGTPSPLLFVGPDQINAIAPYSLFGRVTTKVRVERGGDWSLPLELRVVDAAPGIFTAGGTGRGQAAAVNSDLSTNSEANPARRGSVITLFGTGEGQTDPGGQDGRVIATDLRRPVLPVTAKVGGRPADVLYAGSAPAQVSGLFQVNLRIPEDAPTGVVTLEIQVGTTPSQPGVTIVVQ